MGAVNSYWIGADVRGSSERPRFLLWRVIALYSVARFATGVCSSVIACHIVLRGPSVAVQVVPDYRRLDPEEFQALLHQVDLSPRIYLCFAHDA